MKLEVSLVPHGQISYVLPSLIKYFQISESWSNGRANIDDIVKFLFTGQMMLWAVFDEEDKQIYGHYITEVKQYPQKKMLVVQYCSGESGHMQFVEDKAFDLLDHFARDAGCSGIEFFGRPGWRPYAKKYGYSVQTVVYEKHFEVKQ